MTQRKHILFICTGNTCRSPMAEGLFRKLSAHHPEWQVPQEQPHGPGRQPVRKRSTSSGSMASISPAMKAALLRMN